MRILLVEDDKKIASAVKKGLEFENFAVDITYTGTDGLDMASTTNYDLIILDWMLPEMDGIEICKTLRSENNPTPILMLTAKTEIEDKVMGLNTGADDYLAKPFAFNELVARIRALLRRTTPNQTTTLACGDLFLDMQTYTAKRNNVEIVLSKKEFALLEYLMRNKGTVVTKDEIIEHVWNYDADVLPNTVEVYIGYLRNKIDKPFKNLKPHIKTVWGIGYKLEETYV